MTSTQWTGTNASSTYTRYDLIAHNGALFVTPNGPKPDAPRPRLSLKSSANSNQYNVFQEVHEVLIWVLIPVNSTRHNSTTYKPEVGATQWRLNGDIIGSVADVV